MQNNPEEIAVKSAESPDKPANALEPVARLRGEVARLFDDFFAGFPSFGAHRRGFEAKPRRRFESAFGHLIPAVDLEDHSKEY